MIIEGARSAFRLAPRVWRREPLLVVPACACFLSAGFLARPATPLLWLTVVTLFVTAALAQGRLYRLAVSESLGLPRARLGAAGARLLATWGLNVVFLLILSLLLFVVVLCTAYAVASAGRGFVGSDVRTWAPAVDGRGRAVVSVVLIAGGAGLAWAAARTSLCSAATMGENRVRMLSTWPMTRGRAWVITLSRLLLSLPPVLLWFAVVATIRLVSQGKATILANHVGAALLFGGVWLPLQVGLLAFHYRTREPDPSARVS